MNLQDLIDGMNVRAQRERAMDPAGLTLSGWIAQLEVLVAREPDAKIAGAGELHSYRGYYCDLALDGADDRPAADVLAEAKEAMGAVFHGYKGGDFVMGSLTPLWCSQYGCASGLRLAGLRRGPGVWVLAVFREDEYADQIVPPFVDASS